GPRPVEQRLDLLFLLVGELLTVAVEELDTVVLRRVVRRSDDAAEVQCQQRDRRRGQHAGDDGVAAGRCDPARKRRLELDAGRARIAPDEDTAAPGPQRCGAAEPFDELGRQVLADNATDAVRAEVLTGHCYLFLNCGALRALCSPAFLRSTIRASRVRNPARLSGTRSSGSASTSARAMPCLTAPAWPLGPPPCTRTRRSYVPSAPATRSGASASIRWVARGKYSSIVRPLNQVAPSPGRRMTRATDVFRFPVPRYCARSAISDPPRATAAPAPRAGGRGPRRP